LPRFQIREGRFGSARHVLVENVLTVFRVYGLALCTTSVNRAESGVRISNLAQAIGIADFYVSAVD
jgi:hypothetical protein